MKEDLNMKEILETFKKKESIDISEILKNAPEGIELFSLLHGFVKFHRVKEVSDDSGELKELKIICKDKYDKYIEFMYNGFWFNSKKYEDAVCVLYPSTEFCSWEGGYNWVNWQRILFNRDTAIGHVICREYNDFNTLADGDIEMYLLVDGPKTTMCMDVFGRLCMLRDIDSAYFEFGNSQVESMFFTQLNSNGYTYNKQHGLLAIVNNVNNVHGFHTNASFKVGDYIWPKEWKQMLACRQYKVIHVTESGYILKQVDHRGRLWKETNDMTYEWAENYEVVPEKYVRKLEHKFDLYAKIVSLKDNNPYTITKIVPDYGYEAKDDAQLAHFVRIPFKDEVLYELAGTEKEKLEEIPLEDREMLAVAEDVYLKSEGYKLDNTMHIDNLKAIEEDMKKDLGTVTSNDSNDSDVKIFGWVPFAKVLARQCDEEEWQIDFFSHKDGNAFVCMGNTYKQCIPYITYTQHLVGTKNKPEDCYITW